METFILLRGILIGLLPLFLSFQLEAAGIEEQLVASDNTTKYFEHLKPDAIMRSGNAVLSIYFIAKGTKYEGYHGVLYQAGKEITEQIPFFKFDHYYLKYYGKYNDRLFPYEKSGWLPQNSAMIPPAGTVKNL